MKLSKKITLGCLVLSFALLFGACSYLQSGTNDTTSNGTKPKESSLNDLKEKQANKTNEISGLESEIEKLNEKQISSAKNILNSKEIVKMDKATLDTIESKCKKPTVEVTNSGGGPKLIPPECKNFNENKKAIDEKNVNLGQAKQDLKNLNDQIRVSQPETKDDGGKDNNGFGGLLTWLLLGLAGIIGLSLLGGLYYLLNSKIGQERELSQRSFGDIRKKHNEFQRLIDQLSDTAKFQHTNLEKQNKLIQSMQNQLKESGGYAVQLQQFYEQPPVYKPEPQFPVSAEDYLNKVGHNGQKASADLIGGLLVQDPNKNQEFLIVKDNALADGLFYAVPSFNRFSTRSDYLTYYQNYYACENPSGGTVWILAPTTVRRVEGGWKLEDMGELEIR